MVRAVLLLFVMVATTSVADAASLRIEGADAEVEMGKYLHLQIVYEGESAVGSADLQQWADDFHIDLRDSGTENLLSGAFICAHPTSGSYHCLLPKRGSIA